MKQMKNRLVSIVVILTMLVSMMIPLTAAAAPTILEVKGFSTTASSPTPVTSENVNITVEVDNIDDSEISGIYYEIENLSTSPGSPVENKTNKGTRSSTYEITFTNVRLTEGTNKITFFTGDVSRLDSKPAYITFTPTTNITDLRFNQVPLDDNLMYPQDPTQTAYTITGKSPNATTIQGYLLGQSNPITALRSNSGDFTFIPSRNSDFNMQAGDNIFRIVANNNTNSYTLTRKFVFNDGGPFLYDGTIQTTAAGSTPQRLVNEPLPQLDQTSATLQGKLKVDLAAGSTTVTRYVYADIQVVNGPTTRVDFSGPTALSTLSSTSTYKIFDLGSIPLALPTSRKQTMIVTFYTGTGLIGQAPQQTFHFNYYDPTAPYVTKVTKILGNDALGVPIEVSLNENGGNEINELPSDFFVYTTNVNPATGTVVANVAGMATGFNATHDSTVGSEERWRFQMSGVRDGNSTLTVVPNGDNNGRLDFPIIVTSTPYMIPINFHNNMMIKNVATDTPACTVGGTPGTVCLQARVMNLPSSEYGNIEVSVNGRTANLSPWTAAATPGDFPNNDSTMMLNLGAARTWSPALPAGESLIVEGRNTVKFSLKLNGTVVTTAQYEIFKFTLPTPTFAGDILPNPLEKFTKAQTPDKYATNASEVSFVGMFTNADTIRMNVRKTDALGNPVLTFDTRNSASGWGYPGSPASGQVQYLNINTSTGGFTTNPVSLPFNGDVVFEFLISNNTGITETRTITISREPVPYRVIKPNLIQVGMQQQASVNGNFVDIKLEAENADSVTFGRNDVVRSKIDPSDNKPYFYYRYQNLKPGNNTINFTVTRGTVQTNGSFVVNNVNTSIEGAQILMPLQNKYKLFEGDMELNFPKDTKLMRNEPTAQQQYLTGDRKLFFGIANTKDGRVSKDYVSDASASFFLEEPTRKFRPISQLYWINAGYINQNDYMDTDKLKEALTGAGQDPYNVDASSSNVRFYQKNTANDMKDMVVPSKRGELTLKYDNSIREDSWKYVTVYQLDIFEDYRGMTTLAWKNIGGVVDPKKNTIKVPIDHFGYFQVMYMYDSFNDITSHEWGRDTLDTLYSKGYMNNKSPALFVPNEPITRGEFATALVKAFDLPLQYSGTQTFRDVQTLGNSNSLYDYKYIETAARAGIVRGNAGGLFNPGGAITRQDAAVMIARAAELKVSSDTAKSIAALQKQFTDGSEIDFYAAPSVEAVTKAGLIQGVENVLLTGQKKATFRFDPRQNFTRVQAAAVLERVLKQQKKLPK